MEVSQFDEIATAVDRALDSSGAVYNQWLNASPLFAFLDKKAKKTLNGGREIQVTLEYDDNDTAQSYSGYDVLDTTPQEILAHAVYSWAQYNVATTVSEDEILKASGPRQIVDLITTRTNNASSSLKNKMATDAFGDGTGNGGKDILGLSAIIGTTGTLGGISRSTYTWWQSQADTTSTVMALDWMATMINSIKGSSGGEPSMVGVCDLILTTQTLYESLESLILPYARTKGTGVGSMGFTSLMYKDTEVAWDEKQTSGRVDFLSSKYMGLRVMKGRDFSLGPWQSPVNQDARVRHLRWMGQVIASNCRRLGVATNKTA